MCLNKRSICIETRENKIVKIQAPWPKKIDSLSYWHALTLYVQNWKITNCHIPVVILVPGWGWRTPLCWEKMWLWWRGFTWMEGRCSHIRISRHQSLSLKLSCKSHLTLYIKFAIISLKNNVIFNYKVNQRQLFVEFSLPSTAQDTWTTTKSTRTILWLTKANNKSFQLKWARLICFMSSL